MLLAFDFCIWTYRLLASLAAEVNPLPLPQPEPRPSTPAPQALPRKEELYKHVVEKVEDWGLHLPIPQQTSLKVLLNIVWFSQVLGPPHREDLSLRFIPGTPRHAGLFSLRCAFIFLFLSFRASQVLIIFCIACVPPSFIIWPSPGDSNVHSKGIINLFNKVFIGCLPVYQALF